MLQTDALYQNNNPVSGRSRESEEVKSRGNSTTYLEGMPTTHCSGIVRGSFRYYKQNKAYSLKTNKRTCMLMIIVLK